VLRRITLHLGRDRDHPEGSARHRYDIVAPLDAHARVDQDAWKELRGRCTVRRFRPDEPDRSGWLAHRPGGADGASWVIDYETGRSEDDERFVRLEQHRLAEGEYVTLVDDDDETTTYRIVSVRPA
jgi:hypothetical protein